MPAVNDVGEPCAEKPHARFDGRELETEHPGHGHGEEHLAGNQKAKTGSVTYHQKLLPRQLPTLHPYSVTEAGRVAAIYLARRISFRLA